jgi:hypothetical protein
MPTFWDHLKANLRIDVMIRNRVQKWRNLVPAIEDRQVYKPSIMDGML